MPGKPKNQFSRPSIDLGGPKKVWATVQAAQIEEQDLIKGRGLVLSVVQHEKSVHLSMASGLVIVEHEKAEIEAYVKVRRA